VNRRHFRCWTIFPLQSPGGVEDRVPSLNRLAELTRLSHQMISFIETNWRIPKMIK